MVAPKDGASTAPGTGYESGKQNTPLQKHVAFFDSDNDGVIWPSDTYDQRIRSTLTPLIVSFTFSYIGFRALKFGVSFSFLATLIIHSGFS
jgi:hypothetical protein